ncbi:hypothetical protein HSBAA_37590 [Vreelandella sulfidaeris]|uniref:Uncharacterized protein n=1 Tax=Vreelandella sulfidaeris TaxID=115553 RepID=A0A455UAY7_9GAMM|nr:hypothetical protein HSBAA_37590 [Halomonas sulfidaeris]
MEHYLSLLLPRYLLKTWHWPSFGDVYFLGSVQKVSSAIGLGIAVIVVLTVTVPVNNLVFTYLLQEGALTWTGISGAENIDLSFLGLLSYIGVIAALVQIMEMFLDKYVPSLYNALGYSCRLLPLTAPSWVAYCSW